MLARSPLVGNRIFAGRNLETLSPACSHRVVAKCSKSFPLVGYTLRNPCVHEGASPDFTIWGRTREKFQLLRRSDFRFFGPLRPNPLESSGSCISPFRHPHMKRSLEICALIVAIYCVGYPQQRPCPTLLPTLRTWEALYRSYTSYRICDDGFVGEQYSESEARLLVDHWKTLPRLASLARENVDSRRFVLRHVDASLDMKDVGRIKVKVRIQCPRELRVLCDDLGKQADSALKEDQPRAEKTMSLFADEGARATQPRFEEFFHSG